MSTPPPTQVLAEAMASMTEMLGPVMEAVDGYKAEAERRGYSPTVAEAMALDFHRMVIAQMVSALGGKS